MRVEVNDRLFTVRIFDRPAGRSTSQTPRVKPPRGSRSAATNGRQPLGNDILAPMHGVVVEIGVALGDVVTEGQVVAVVEAMKMMNEIRAHRAGTVEAVLVEPGLTVEPQAPLLRLDA
jgi:acetyl-CoA/propionyl-CoA carboxylase biotin carboxyl carrier protein